MRLGARSILTRSLCGRDPHAGPPFQVEKGGANVTGLNRREFYATDDTGAAQDEE